MLRELSNDKVFLTVVVPLVLAKVKHPAVNIHLDLEINVFRTKIGREKSKCCWIQKFRNLLSRKRLIAQGIFLSFPFQISDVIENLSWIHQILGKRTSWVCKLVQPRSTSDGLESVCKVLHLLKDSIVFV